MTFSGSCNRCEVCGYLSHQMVPGLCSGVCKHYEKHSKGNETLQDFVERNIEKGLVRTRGWYQDDIERIMTYSYLEFLDSPQYYGIQFGKLPDGTTPGEGT